MKMLMMVAVMAALMGCATVSGVGQDISGSANWVAGRMGG